MRPALSPVIAGPRSVCEGCGRAHPRHDTKLVVFACDQCGRLKVNSLPPLGSSLATTRYQSFLAEAPEVLELGKVDEIDAENDDDDDAEPVSLSDRDVFVFDYDAAQSAEARGFTTGFPRRATPSAMPPG